MSALISRLQKWFPRKKLDIFGKDSLIKRSLPYYVLVLLTLPPLLGADPNPFLFICIVYFVFPLLDEFFSLDVRNPDQKERRELENDDWSFRMPLYAAMLSDWIIFLKIMHHHTTHEITLSNLFTVCGTIFLTSNLYSVQFVVSHQIMHKSSKFYRFLGTIHMSKLLYMHFTYHHLYCHHQKVATLEDPSTSIKGETVYQFIPRCIKDSWIGVYQAQKQNGKSLLKNYAVLSILANIVFCSAVYLVFGLQSLVIHVLMATGSIIYLQAINYIEHYGLLRKKIKNGDYEKVTILHSWNAPQRFTNYMLFKLQRHSDHHENSTKPYQTLISLEKSPFLPHGYTLMILMSFFPKVWFKVMDPLADAYSKLDYSKGQAVDPVVMEKSMTDTRKFLIQIGLSTAFLLALSTLRYI